MTTYTDAKQLSAAQHARARRLRYGYVSIEAACRAGAEIAYDEARKLTSGTITTKELVRAGHPFARSSRMLRMGEKGKGGIAFMRAYPLTPINKQTGGVSDGWRIIRVQGGNGGYVYRLQNIDPKAKFVLAPGGTVRMVPRGFFEELNRRVKSKARAKKVEMYRLALKG